MMETTNTPEMIQHFLDELQRPAKPLSDWESSYLISISNQFENRGRLSDKQFRILEGIYSEKTA